MTQKHCLLLRLIGLTWLVVLGTAASGSADAGELRYEVTVTNLTRGQGFTPAVVVTHNRHLHPLFTEGAPASPELASIAEDGDVRPMVNLLTSDPNVRDVAVLQGTVPLPLPPAGPGGFAIRPGASASVVVAYSRDKHLVSLVGMLASTNDGFYALNGVAGPRHRTVTYHSVAWDAGSEVNNEDCQVLPGPPCGVFFVRAPEGAEGYVHVHPGIHGIGNLVPATHDWRNPVATMTIRRLAPDDGLSREE